MSWIRTASGRRIDFLSPDVSQITLGDIGVAMARIARFGGHSPLKIAQHVCEVATLMMMRAREQGMSEVEIAEAGIVGFVHDFPEYVVCDVMTPLKRLLAPLYDPIEARILDAIVERFGLEGLMEKYADLLTWADRQAVVEEALRFNLDGKYLSEVTGEWEDADFAWVDPSAPRYLADRVWDDEEELHFSVTASFLRLMVEAGRISVLTNETTGIPDTTTENLESLRDFRIPMPPILISGEVIL